MWNIYTTTFKPGMPNKTLVQTATGSYTLFDLRRTGYIQVALMSLTFVVSYMKDPGHERFAVLTRHKVVSLNDTNDGCELDRGFLS